MKKRLRIISFLCALVLCLESVAFAVEIELNSPNHDTEEAEIIVKETPNILVEPENPEEQPGDMVPVEQEFAESLPEGIQATASTSFGTVSALMKSLRADINAAVYNTDLSAPFSKAASGAQESVNTETGTIIVSNDIFHMPGCNEFDFTLRLKYSNQDARVFDETTKASGFKNTGTAAITAYFDVFDANGYWLGTGAKNYSFTQTIESTLTQSGNQWVFLGYYDTAGASALSKASGIANSARKRTASETAKYSFGVGWSLDLPGIVVEDDSVYVTLADGQTYKSNGNAATGLEKYPLSDVKFSTDTSQTVGTEKSAYKLRYADGTSNYYTAAGEILLQTDRFGNSISYTYSGTGANRYLTKVENSAGLSISLTYSDAGVTITYGKNSASIVKTAVTGGQILSAYVDPLGRRTTYDYTMASASFDLLGKTAAQNTYANLNEITYPTGLTTGYAYASSKKNLADGYMEYYRVSKRWNQYGGKQYNAQSYSYIGEPDGYPTYKRTAIPNGYTYSTTVQDGVATQVFIYNYKHQPEKIETLADGIRETALIRYDDSKNLPIYRELRTTSSSGENVLISVSTYAYDDLGNVVEENSPPAPDLLFGGEYIIKSTYDSRYNLPLSKQFKQSADSRVEVKYGLSEDGKKVTSQKVLSNGVPLQEEIYSYDGFGNLTQTSTRISGNNWATQRLEYQNGVFPIAVTLFGLENAAGAKTSVTTRYTYDQYTGNLLSATDGLGFVTGYGYDAVGRQLWEALPDGSRRTTAYDDKANILSKTDAAGTTLVYGYTPSGLLSSVTNAKDGKTLVVYEYDARENLISEKNAIGTKSVYTYDARSRVIQSSVFASDGKLVSQRRAAYNDAFSDGKNTYQKITVSIKGDERDLEQSYFYDARQRLVKQSRGSDTAFWTYDYLDNQIGAISYDGAAVTMAYDALSRLTAVTDATGGTTIYAYDGLGNPASATNPLGVTAYTKYDARGLLVRQESPMDDGTLAITRYWYDANSRLEAQTDAESGVTRYAYDSRGNPIRVEQRVSTTESIVTAYIYDREGRMLSSEIGGAQTSYAYDELGRLVAETDALGQVTGYQYDVVGNLANKIDRNGTITSYEYDALGRVLSFWNSKDGLDKAVTSTYALDGALLESSNAEGTTRYSYDALGRLTEETTSPGFRKTYAYDKADRVSNLSVYQGTVREMNLSYDYDAAGRLTAISSDGVRTAYEYDAAGQLAREENGLTGVITAYQYMPMGQLKSQMSYSGGDMIAHSLYRYDKRGNLTGKMENGRETQYWYDGASRLKTAELPGGVTQDYGYDSRGNIARMAELRDGRIDETLYVYDRNNRLLSMDQDGEISLFDYDAAGNMTAKTTQVQSGWMTVSGTFEYLWNGYGQLQTVLAPEGSVTEYGYGSDGLRVRKTTAEAETRYLCQAASVILETDGDGFITAKNIRGLRLISRETRDETFGYLHNGHGDVTALVSPAGEIIHDYEYDPYGNGLSTDNTPPYPWLPSAAVPNNPFRYCGEYLDEETGFYYLRARYYDPGANRFASEDPIQSGLNWYIYCSNNPVNFIDPWGLVEVGLRSYAETYEGSEVDWDPKTSTASVKWNGKTITVVSTAQNNRNGNIYVDDSLFVNAFGIGCELVVYQDKVTSNVSIRASFSYEDNAAYYMIPGSDTSDNAYGTSYSRAFLQGIEEYWSGTFGEYEVSTYVGFQKDGIRVEFKDKLGVSKMISGLFGWSTSNPGKIIMYSGDSRGNGDLYSLSDYKWVSAHEFGHILGVGDAYNSKKSTSVTSIFNDFGTGVQEGDIAMVLKAWNAEKWQKWP